MRILILLLNDKLGGAEQYLKMVGQFHKNNDVQVLFLKNTLSGQWDDTTNNITKVFLNSRFQLISIFKLVGYFLKHNNNFDYSFTSHVSINAILGILVKLRLVKTKYFIARESTSIFARFSGTKLFIYKLAYYLGYGKIDLLICQSNYMKEQLFDGLPKKLRKLNIKVIPNPVDLNLIREKETAKPDILLTNNYIVSAGRLIREKGYDVLIEAFSVVSNEHPKMKLLILGEGSERRNLESLIEKLNLNDKVILQGFVSNVYPIFKNANLCIVSSRIEGFPNVLLQMMSQNGSIVSTLCAGGIEDLPKITKIPTNDVKAMSNAISKHLNIGDFGINKSIFEEYLDKRSIAHFMKKVHAHLDNKILNTTD